MLASSLRLSLKEFSLSSHTLGGWKDDILKDLDAYYSQISFKHFLQSPKENLFY